MSRASAIANETPNEPTPADFGVRFLDEEQPAALPQASAALVEMERVPGAPKTPLHISVKNLETREGGRENEVRLLHEALAELERQTKERVRELEGALNTLGGIVGRQDKRLRELGDWVDLPQADGEEGE